MASSNPTSTNFRFDPAGKLFRFRPHGEWPLAARQAHAPDQQLERYVRHPVICLHRTTWDGAQCYEVVTITSHTQKLKTWANYIPVGHDKWVMGRVVKGAALAARVQGVKERLPRNSWVVLDSRRSFAKECFYPFWAKKVGNGKRWQYRLTVEGLKRCRRKIAARQAKLRKEGVRLGGNMAGMSAAGTSQMAAAIVDAGMILSLPASPIGAKPSRPVPDTPPQQEVEFGKDFSIQHLSSAFTAVHFDTSFATEGRLPLRRKSKSEHGGSPPKKKSTFGRFVGHMFSKNKVSKNEAKNRRWTWC